MQLYSAISTYLDDSFPTKILQHDIAVDPESLVINAKIQWEYTGLYPESF
jgi:hypothetical protein